MADVEFEDSRVFNNNISSGSKMINFLIKKGVVKDTEGAFKVLISLAVVLIILSAYFFWSAYKKTVISPDDSRFKLTEEGINSLSPELQEKIRANQK